MAHQATGPTSAARNFGWELRRLRQAAGLSQREMAQALGYSAHSVISDYESARRIPPNDVLVAYERLFGVPDSALQRMRALALRERADQRACEEARAAGAEMAESAESHAPVRTRSSTEALAEVRRTAGATDSGTVHGTNAQTNAAANASVRRRKGRLRQIRPRMSVVLTAVTVPTVVTGTVAMTAYDTAHADRPGRVAGRQADRQHADALGGADRLSQDLDGDDPRARACNGDAVTLQQVRFSLPNDTAVFGTLQLRHSARCGTDWATAYTRNLHLYTVQIAIFRPLDRAEVHSSWSKSAPTVSYGDMLSVRYGCAWVSVVVITPEGTSTPVHTDCLR